MRLSKSKLALVGLVVMGCIVLIVFWNLPTRPRAKTVSKSLAMQPSSTSGFNLPAPPQTTSLVPISTASLAQLRCVSTNATPKLDRFKYRLTNTAKPIDQLLRDDQAILLENALLDTSQPIELAFPRHLKSTNDPGSYIVQARGPIDDTFRAVLARSGASIVSYIPNNAYLVRASAAVAQQLAANRFTHVVIPFEPYYKLKGDLLRLAVERKPLPKGAFLTVALFADTAEETVQQIEQLGCNIIGRDSSPFGPVVRVEPADDWITLPMLSGVHIVELGKSRVLANDLSRVRMDVAWDTTTASNYLGLSGKDVVIAVADSGVDRDHPDLAGRVILGLGADGTDVNGHGTHVAGILVSSGANGPNGTNVSGSVDGATFRGLAPEAKVFALPVLMVAKPMNSAGTPAVSDAALQQEAAKTNVLISLNAWNYGGENSYNIAAASYDAAVRDALPGVTGPQPVLFVFSAGNDGMGSDNGLSGNADSILAPATAKNVLTVGAIEQLRYVTNQVEEISDGTTNRFTPWLGMTDSANEVASFSSRGNVGIGYEGDAGRFKPDVVAPGTFVLSTRATHWDKDTYFDGKVQHSTIYEDQFTETNMLNFVSLYVPSNAVEVMLEVVPNRNSPVPFPQLQIYVWPGTDPRESAPVGPFANGVTAPADLALAPVGTFWWFGISNTTQKTVFHNIITRITTEELKDYMNALSNLNESVGPFYRFESGTSMAAANAAGLLALVQEFFQKMNITNSPALMKALVINGARSVNPIYDFQTRAPINYQGWGLIHLPTILHPGLTNPTPSFKFDTDKPCSIKLLDQNPTNALATGESLTWKLEIANSNAITLPLRITLVWTDPPGNPAASVKLVNDLDLIVTNLDTTNVYFGNDIAAGGLFNLPWDGVSTITNDAVNNVENVYIAPPLGTNYSITVVARRVNVNAVTIQTNNVLQDFALVISCGDGEVPDALRIVENGAPTFESTPAVEVTYVTNTFQDATTVGALLLHQRAGASFQLLGTNTIILGQNSYWATNSTVTLGVTNQWHFYVVTNTQNYTNAAFVTFLPPTLSLPRGGVYSIDPEEEATRQEADIDLFVARGPQNWALTNLDPVILEGAYKAVSRGGTELIAFTNAEPGEVFYIGVKAEDQMAAEYGFVAVFSLLPFSESTERGIAVRFFPLPAGIPDGDNARPGVAYVFGISIHPAKIRRAIAQAEFLHENFGDLVGNLSHNRQFAVLNNHYNSSIAPPGPYGFVYEDNNEGVPEPLFAGQNVEFITSSGPGTLRSFVGEEAAGLWLFTIVDSHLTQTGALTGFSLLVEPQDLTKGMVATVEGHAWKYFSVDVPPEATNLTVILTLLSNSLGPLDLYVRRDAFPTETEYDKCLLGIVAPGGALTIGKSDSPPLNAGRYYVGVFNPTTTPQTFEIQVLLSLDVGGVRPNVFGSTNIVPILDNAILTSSIPVSVSRKISRVEVALAVAHPRISDLAFTLVSPQGTRVLLCENRGATTTNGFGSFVLTTNIVFENSFESTGSNSIELAGNYFAGGWYVESGSIDLIRAASLGSSAYDGSWYIDLDGNSPGTISTNISTEPGQIYRLSFAYTRNPESVSLECVPRAEVLVDSNVIAFLEPNYSNTWAELNWQVATFSFKAESPSTKLTFRSADPQGPYPTGTHGVLLDNVQILEEKAQYSYVVFTENTNRTFIPVKYAQPPFVVEQTPANVDSFETASPGEYISGMNFQGWVVLSNQVTVTADPYTAFKGTNLLALAKGKISKSLPVLPGKNYALSFAYRGPGIVGFWRGEDNAADSANAFDGQLLGGMSFGNGLVGRAFYNSGPPSTARVKIPDNEAFSLTNSLTLEGWVKPEGAGYVVLWRGDTGAGVVPYQLSLQGDNRLWFIIQQSSSSQDYIEAHLPYNQWTHIAATLDGYSGLMRIYTNGVVGAEKVTSVRPLGNLYPGIEPCVGIANVGDSSAGMPFNGLIDEASIYSRALSPSEVKAIAEAGAAGKFDAAATLPEGLAKARFILGNSADVLLSGTNDKWQTNVFQFTATSDSVDVVIEGLQPGMLLDEFILTEMGDDIFYLPEESLDAFKGENSYGVWQLEVWDTRFDATNPAPTILNWQLRFLFDTAMPSTIGLTHAVPVTTTIGTNEMQFFYVDVPSWARAATNSILYATAPVNLWFNQNGVPNGTGTGGDVLLLDSVTCSSFTLTSNSVPPLLSGRRYYLAVQNTGPDPVTCTIMVEFDVITLTNGIPFSVEEDTVYRGRMYQFDVSSNATALVFMVTNLTGNVDLVVKSNLPLPTLSRFDYGSFAQGTLDELVTVFTNSVPVPVGPGRWYAGVFNQDITNAAYTIVVIELTNPIPPIITLTNAVPYVNTNSGGASPIDYYSFVVSEAAVRVQFEINEPTEDMALVVRKQFPPLPDLLIHDYMSDNPGTNDEVIVVFDFSQPVPLTAGQWFIGAVNLAGAPVSYSIKATEWTEHGTNIVCTNQMFPGRFCLTWNSLPGAHYVVEGTPSLPPAYWVDVSPTITAVSTETTWCIPLPSLFNFFRVREGIALTPVPIELVHGIPVSTDVGPNQVRYFYVDVPVWATTVTNMVVTATVPVELLFNQTTLPSITNGAGDETLLQGITTGIAVLRTNSVPPLLPGQRYYLAVFNRNSVNAAVTVGVEFDIIRLTNGIPLRETIRGGHSRVYVYEVSTNAVQVEFAATNLSGNVDIVVRKGVPLPTLMEYDYASLGSGTNDERIIVAKSSVPVPLSAGKWYLGVFNVEPTNVDYSIVAIETTVMQNIVTLTNAIGYVATNTSTGEAVDYYRFAVSSNAVRVQFEVNGPSGLVALAVRRGYPPLPGLTNYHYLSDNAGRNDELIVVFDNSTPVPVEAGEWYLAVVNLSGGTVMYSVKATEWAERGTNVVIGRVEVQPDQLCITWNSLPGVHYVVEGTPSLVMPFWTNISPTITATSTQTTWCVSLPSLYQFFRIREGLALVDQTVQVAIERIVRSPSGIELEWQAQAGQRFKVQWIDSIGVSSWNTFTNIVTSSTGQFHFTDDGSQTGGLGQRRFYRLVLVE